MKTTSPEAASAAALKPIIDHAQKNLGTLKALAEAMTARTGQTVYRQSIEKWIHPDKKKRKSPLLGIGLILIEEGRKLIENTPKDSAK